MRNANPWSTRVLPRASEMVSFTSLLMAIGCGGDGSGNANLSAATLCARGCARATAANCTHPDPMCTVECEQELASSPPACSQQLNAFASCMTKATFTCDLNGEAEAKECDAQLAAWATCQQIAGGSDAGRIPGGDAGVSSTGDAGITSPSTDSGATNAPATDSGTPVAAQDSGTTPIPVVDSGTTPIPAADGGPIADAGGSDASTIDFSCTPNASDDACDQCFKAECCTELSTCGPDCMALLTCIDACETNTCVQNCFSSYPSALDQFDVLANCEEARCAEACDDTTDTTSSSKR